MLRELIAVHIIKNLSLQESSQFFCVWHVLSITLQVSQIYVFYVRSFVSELRTVYITKQYCMIWYSVKYETWRVFLIEFSQIGLVFIPFKSLFFLTKKVNWNLDLYFSATLAYVTFL
jgi:hypothetical protein